MAEQSNKKCIWRGADDGHCDEVAAGGSNYCEQHSPDKSYAAKGSRATWTEHSDKAQTASHRWTSESR